MTPLRDFAGEIDLTVSADSLITSELLYDKLSYDRRVNEVLIRLDTSIATGLDSLFFIATYEGRSDSLAMKFRIVQAFGSGFSFNLQKEFAGWLSNEHPEFGITLETEWFGYNKFPEYIGLECVFLSDTWDMQVLWFEDYGIATRQMLLRPRGCIKPVFAAQKNSDGTFSEIAIEDYY